MHPTLKKEKLEKGIAYPFSFSLNNIVEHLSPVPKPEKDFTLAEGDVLSVDFGVQLSGHPVLLAHPIIVPGGASSSSASQVTGRKADVLVAAQTAAAAIERLLKNGTTGRQITQTVTEIADTFHVHHMEGYVSHTVEQWQPEGDKSFRMRAQPNSKPVKDVVFEENDVVCIDIVMSSGEGRGIEREVQPTIYRRDGRTTYTLKMQTSIDIFKEIRNKFKTFAFRISDLTGNRTRFALADMSKHSLVQPHPVLFEREGEFVAHLKFTTALLPDGTAVRLTGAHPAPAFSNSKSEYSVTSETLKTLLSKPVGQATPASSAPPMASSAASH